MNREEQYILRSPHEIGELYPLGPGLPYQTGCSLLKETFSSENNMFVSTTNSAGATIFKQCKTSTGSPSPAGVAATPQNILRSQWAETTLSPLKNNYGHADSLLSASPTSQLGLAIDPQLLRLSTTTTTDLAVTASAVTPTIAQYHQLHTYYMPADGWGLGWHFPLAPGQEIDSSSLSTNYPMISLTPDHYGLAPTLKTADPHIPRISEIQSSSLANALNPDFISNPTKKGLRSPAETTKVSGSQGRASRFHPYSQKGTATESNANVRARRGTERYSLRSLKSNVTAVASSVKPTRKASSRRAPEPPQPRKTTPRLPRHGDGFSGESFDCGFKGCSHKISFLPSETDADARLRYQAAIEKHLKDQHRPRRGERCQWLMLNRETQAEEVCGYAFRKDGSTNDRHIRNKSHANCRVICDKCSNDFCRNDKLSEHHRKKQCKGVQEQSYRFVNHSP